MPILLDWGVGSRGWAGTSSITLTHVIETRFWLPFVAEHLQLLARVLLKVEHTYSMPLSELHRLRLMASGN